MIYKDSASRGEYWGSACLTVDNVGSSSDVLDRFRDFCRKQGKQYTKVLQLLAELYLETDGAVLDGRASVGPVAPEKKKLQVQVESLQNKLLEDLLKRVEILEKQKIKTDYELDRIHKSVAFIQSGLQEPR